MTAMKEQPSARQIYGTIGPACADVETLEAMFRAGMTAYSQWFSLLYHV